MLGIFKKPTAAPTVAAIDAHAAAMRAIEDECNAAAAARARAAAEEWERDAPARAAAAARARAAAEESKRAAAEESKRAAVEAARARAAALADVRASAAARAAEIDELANVAASARHVASARGAVRALQKAMDAAAAELDTFHASGAEWSNLLPNMTAARQAAQRVRDMTAAAHDRQRAKGNGAGLASTYEIRCDGAPVYYGIVNERSPQARIAEHSAAIGGIAARGFSAARGAQACHVAIAMRQRQGAAVSFHVVAEGISVADAAAWERAQIASATQTGAECYNVGPGGEGAQQ